VGTAKMMNGHQKETKLTSKILDMVNMSSGKNDTFIIKDTLFNIKDEYDNLKKTSLVQIILLTSCHTIQYTTTLQMLINAGTRLSHMLLSVTSLKEEARESIKLNNHYEAPLA
jgi:hypothetical protein